jgi:Na+-driven multidrug efflux pump
LFNPAFASSASIFNIYLLLVISRLVFPQVILTGLAYTREIMLASFLELLVNVAFSLVLVSWLGIAGVAAGTVIAFLFEKILLSSMVRRKLGIRASGYIPLKLLSAYSVLTGVVFIFAELFFTKYGLLVG